MGDIIEVARVPTFKTILKMYYRLSSVLKDIVKGIAEDSRAWLRMESGAENPLTESIFSSSISLSMREGSKI